MTKTGEWIKSNVHHSGDDCLIWPFGRDGGGYARATLEGFKTRLAHRIMCELAHGAPGDEHSVARHLCGKGHEGCVNPRHLAWGRISDNISDRSVHGTQAKGEKIGISVLTKADVMQVRNMSAMGKSQRKIAEQFSVSHGTIQAILEGRTWRHVP